MSTIELEMLPVALRQRVLVVEFRSLDERSWTAVGDGPADAAAIEYARESAWSCTFVRHGRRQPRTLAHDPRTRRGFAAYMRGLRDETVSNTGSRA